VVTDEYQSGPPADILISGVNVFWRTNKLVSNQLRNPKILHYFKIPY